MTSTGSARLVDGFGRELTLARELGRGGEGTTYELAGNEHRGFVAKLWHPAIMRDETMLAAVAGILTDGWQDPSGHRRIAPIVTFSHDEYGRLAGVLLERLRDGLVPLSEFLTVADRTRAGVAVSYRWRLRLATRVADLVARAHDSGLVIADLGPQNLAIDPRRARVTAFDVDSWQALDHPIQARAVTEDARAPEHAGPEDPALPTIASDRWSLAVAVTQILFDGRHPCDGVPADGSAPFAVVLDNVRRGYSHLCAGALRHVAGAPALQLLPAHVAEQAALAFGPGHLDPRLRPDARAWVVALHADAALPVWSRA